ncbi:MAG: NAD-dependent succinate-semialdehyde dehydrogenase, partial [Anaerolineales bacterium]|nr:NAD-dependent succinate-semialdehyde dehydrogenase [Anaerolineales bacterium]
HHGMSMSNVNLNLFINGKWVPADSGETFEVINPVNAKPMGTAARAGKAETRRALEAAQQAFQTWRWATPDERSKALKKAARAIAEKEEELARILTEEHGKPLGDARKEIRSAIDTFEYYGEEARRVSGEVAPSKSASARSLVIRQPIGVVAAIAPWNYPVLLMAWKLAPALAAGCTVVVKPPALAPLACGLVAGIVGESGLPSGAVNVITGPSGLVGQELLSNPITRMIAFTGSTETGKQLMAAAAPDLKKLILELGGHSPMVVFKDADLEKAVADGVKRSFRNMGQICNAVNRIYVEADIADAYIQRFVELTSKMTIGDGLANPNVDLGPMIDQEGIQRTQAHVDDALAKGARLLYGGKRPDRPELKDGFFYEPAVLTNVTKDMLVMHEESFGPVVGIDTFKGLDEAVALANSTPYGLVSYAYTRDLATAFAFGERVDSGSVAINSVSPDSLYAPYPAWKHSGIGLELSHYGLEEYLQVKHLLLDIG